MAASDFVTEGLLDALSAAIAGRHNTLKGNVGDKTALATTVKTSLVAAINELHAAVASATGINDGATGTGSTWSSQKIADTVAAAVTSILGSASAAYDTLGEVQALMAADDTETTGILTALGNRLRFDAAQTLTAPQKAQALANLGIVVSTANFASAFNAATA